MKLPGFPDVNVEVLRPADGEGLEVRASVTFYAVCKMPKEMAARPMMVANAAQAAAKNVYRAAALGSMRYVPDEKRLQCGQPLKDASGNWWRITKIDYTKDVVTLHGQGRFDEEQQPIGDVLTGIETGRWVVP